uniref:Uncharacterized protein n=1 Tax=Cacopsylla melanoneura TaxID=428564 RepID=A0A8D8XIZ2_9HEMI
MHIKSESKCIITYRYYYVCNFGASFVALLTLFTITPGCRHCIVNVYSVVLMLMWCLILMSLDYGFLIIISPLVVSFHNQSMEKSMLGLNINRYLSTLSTVST